MRNKDQLITELAGGLARLGWPTKHLKRIVDEVSGHWEDLEAEAREAGLEAAAASDFAKERIGEPQTLIRLHHDAMRKTHWCARHPVFSFVVLPPIALVLWFLAWLAMAGGASEVYGKLLGLQQPVWKSYLLVLIATKVIHYTGVFAVPAFFWWWARRNFCGVKWSWIACAMCALHGLLNQVTVRAHSLHWGYGIVPPDWLPVFAPLIVAGLAHWGCRWKPGLAMMMGALLLTGCASSKLPQQRGWIGGEYKHAMAGKISGILITSLATNTPVAQSGLRDGDVILQVRKQPMTNLEAFRKVIDGADPGTELPLTIFRDGTTLESRVVVGKEIFKPSRAITVGVLLSDDWDPWPNPDFSLVALGYKRQHKRVELDSPESRFKLAAREDKPDGEDRPDSVRSSEGWEVWLPVCKFSSRKRILLQSVAD